MYLLENARGEIQKIVGQIATCLQRHFAINNDVISSLFILVLVLGSKQVYKLIPLTREQEKLSLSLASCNDI